MSSDFPDDLRGGRLTDPLPHYIKEESFVFHKISSRPADTDIISDFIGKYVQPGSFTEIRKGLSQNMVLAKHKVRPDFNVVPRSRKSHLSLREKRQLGLYKLPRKGLKYQEFLKLNELWKQYMLDSLDLSYFASKKGEVNVVDKHWDQLSTQLFKADYHGAQLSVIRSRCPSHVGVRGIVVMDTKNTFKILGEDNVVRTIPKESTVFQFRMNQFRLTLYGKHLCIKPAERTTKKIRSFLSTDL